MNEIKEVSEEKFNIWDHSVNPGRFIRSEMRKVKYLNGDYICYRCEAPRGGCMYTIEKKDGYLLVCEECYCNHISMHGRIN